MAKNLKLNIKNTQLAEALKRGQIKRGAAPVPKEKENSVASETAATAPAPPSPTLEKREEISSPIQDVTPRLEGKQPPPELPATEKKSYPEETSLPTETRESKAKPDFQTILPHPDTFPKKESDRSETPSYNPRNRPPYTPGGNRPPYPSSGNRPPYTPHGNRPPYTPGGNRPPYTPSGNRPPYTPNANRPPYTPGGNRPPYASNGNRPAHTPGGRPPYSPGGNRPSYPPRLPPAGAPNRDFAPKPPIAEPSREIKKPGPLKEYRDVKPQKKTTSTGNKSFDSRDRSGLRDSEGEGWRKKRPAFRTQYVQEEAIIRPKNLKIRIPITVKDLASEMKLKSSELISKMFMQGVVITLNDYLTDETVIQLLGHEFDCEIAIDTSQEERLRITDKSIKDEIAASNPTHLVIRPPVVAFMGHVDHGKTSLIDAIRATNMASDEAGAITQHIGAFRCHTSVGDITILDTPGHEAFSTMRSRGADITDIVVLVVAGDEGIRTQTIEAIEQARSADVPIVVAINKCDKPNFNAENIYRQLADQNLLPEAWGGTTLTINCSALTKAGVNELLSMLALQAEVLELKANPSARARGTVIESEMHKGLGAVATVLVQNGTLQLNDAVVFAQHWARIKTMQDEAGHDLEKAGPSTPVKITGLSGLPLAGSDFIVVKSEREARELAEERSQGHKNLFLLQKKKMAFENLLQQEASKNDKKVLNLIIRADVQGSLEALKNSLHKISSTKVDLLIISEGVGEITESDIQLASASKATLLGFHTKIENHADSLIKQLKINVRLHDIIYHAVDDVKEIMRQLLDKISQETNIGEALVKAVFKASQLGSIAGCQVIDGVIKRNHPVRVLRGGVTIWKGAISTLKRVKEDVREVSKGLECGILLQNFNEIQEGDIIQAFEITYLEQAL